MNHTPFHNFQQHETSIKAYALPITHLVAALIRRGFDDFKLPVNEQVVRALARFDEGITPEAVHQLLLSIWTHEWTWTAEQPYCDPTICFLSMFTLQKDGTFSQAKDVTGIIAKLTRAIRLTILRESHLKLERGEAPNLLKAFEGLGKFVVESSQSTFQTLQYYQHYASSIAFQTMSLPRIIYPERLLGDYTVMMYEGHRITVPQVKEVMSGLEQDIVAKLKDEVLLNLEFHAELGTPVDKLQSTERAYSFISDPSNPFHETPSTLGEHILRNSKLRDEFVQSIPGTNRVTWNVQRARQWLQSLADVEALLLLSVEMKSGAPVRLTELTSMLACNIDTRTRNLYAFGRDILLCTQYNKNTNNDQADRMIPHALATFDADVLLQIHSLARPFAQVRYI
jgi:bloom syndrome protein